VRPSLLFPTGIAGCDLLRGGGAATDARRAARVSGSPGHDFFRLSSTGLHPDRLGILADTASEEAGTDVEAGIDAGGFTMTCEVNSSDAVRFLDTPRLLTNQRSSSSVHASPVDALCRP